MYLLCALADMLRFHFAPDLVKSLPFRLIIDMATSMQAMLTVT
jgi:hypothetical protein